MPHRIPTHRSPAQPPASSRHRLYDRTARDQVSKAFYDCARWRKARLMHLREHPLCAACLQDGQYTAASHVHHVIELASDRGLALDGHNLQSLCHSHHSQIHACK